MAADPLSSRKNPKSYVLEIVFLIWTIALNVLYYLQFRELFLANFGRWIQRWR
jgi:hypothetical protein